MNVLDDVTWLDYSVIWRGEHNINISYQICSSWYVYNVAGEWKEKCRRVEKWTTIGRVLVE